MKKLESQLNKIQAISSRLKRVFLKLSFILISVFMISGYWLTMTASGAQCVIRLISWVSPYQITVENLKGSLLNAPLSVSALHISHPTLDIQADKTTLAWRPLKLLSGKLVIEEFTTQSMIIKGGLKKISPTPQLAYFSVTEQLKKLETINQFNWKSLIESTLEANLPMAISIKNLQANHLVINDIIINHLSLTGAASKHGRLFKTLSVKTPEIQIDADFRDAHTLSWYINIPELKKYHATLQGDLITHGKWIAPPLSTESAQASYELTKINIYFQSKKLVYNKIISNNLTASLSGTVAQHASKISGKINNIDINTTFTGLLASHKTHTQWTGHLSHFSVKNPQLNAITLTHGQFIFTQESTKLQLQSTFELWGKNPVRANITLNPTQAKPLHGLLEAKIQDLRSLAIWLPALHRLNGQGEIHASLSGTLSHPEITGEAKLTQLSSSIPSLGTHLEINNLTFTGLGRPKVIIHGTGSMGNRKNKINNNQFTLSGEANMIQNKPELNIKLSGNRLLISNTPEYYIIASPELNLTIKNGVSQITGSIHIPEANITPLDELDTISPSDDVVLVSKKNKKLATQPNDYAKQVSQLAYHTKTKIQVTFGEKIFFKGYGLSSHINGKITLEDSPGQLTKAFGRIILVNGKYQAFGHTLALQHGQLIFNGDPLFDPKLDIRAERKIVSTLNNNNLYNKTHITAGIQLHGKISKIQTQLYSSPALNDQDIISYLVLGHPQIQAKSGAEAEALFQAAQQIAFAFNPKSSTEDKTLAERLKMDTLGFTNAPYSKKGGSTLENTVFTVGKKLSNRLYVHYSLGLVDNISSYGMRYLLGSHIVLEAQTDSQNRTSADVMITLESG